MINYFINKTYFDLGFAFQYLHRLFPSVFELLCLVNETVFFAPCLFGISFVAIVFPLDFFFPFFVYVKETNGPYLIGLGL